MAKESCHNCVYAWRDMCQVMAQFALGFPYRPTCANQPGHYGVPIPTPFGKVCRNYRLKPPNPGAEAKRIILTNGMVAYVDAADYEELSRYTWHFAAGYAGRYEKRKLIYMHRQIMNPPEGMLIDHIRGNRLDNTRVHLRICTHAENAQNRAKQGGTSSRYFGVSYWKKGKKWVATIQVERKPKVLGYFDDEEEAARAYDYAAVLYRDEYARLNFPEEWPPERRAQVRAQRAAEAKEKGKSEKVKGKKTSRGKTGGKVKAKGKSKKAKGKNKKSRAEAPGRGGQKRKTQAERATGDEPRTTKKKPPRRTHKAPRRKGT